MKKETEFLPIIKQDFLSPTLIFITTETRSGIIANLAQIIPIYSSVLSL